MNNFGFNGLNNENPLMQYLKQYTQPQQETAQQINDVQRTNSNNVSYEVNSQSELEYIVPDKSGKKQIVDCPNENKVYIGRYNHVRQFMDWQSYINEGEIKLSQKNDTSAEMTQIAEALVAVASKLEAMHNEIQELKKNELIKEESNRRPNGQFKKKGE